MSQTNYCGFKFGFIDDNVDKIKSTRKSSFCAYNYGSLRHEMVGPLSAQSIADPIQSMVLNALDFSDFSDLEDCDESILYTL